MVVVLKKVVLVIVLVACSSGSNDSTISVNLPSASAMRASQLLTRSRVIALTHWGQCCVRRPKQDLGSSSAARNEHNAFMSLRFEVYMYT